MREVLDLLKQAAEMLDDVEDSHSFAHVLGRIASKVYLAHANIKLAEAKLHLLMAKEEETCEKS